MRLISILILSLFILFVNCSKDNTTNPTIQAPILITTLPTNITQTSASTGGDISSDGGGMITARGVCWNTSGTPTIADSKTIDTSGTGSFISKLSGLSPNTTYNVRAYATNSIGTGYGSIVSFTTIPLGPGEVVDIDNNIYHTVTIGTQVWMVENLKTTRYRNGAPIPNVMDPSLWYNLRSGAYCNYDNNPSYAITYGRLYNLSAIYGQIAPTGWHVPSDAEWTILVTFLGGDSLAGRKLKESGTSHWNSPNNGATNETGFTAFPAGKRSNDGAFLDIVNDGYWWSTSVYSQGSSAWGRQLNYSVNNMFRIGAIGNNGFSIRCIKD